MGYVITKSLASDINNIICLAHVHMMFVQCSSCCCKAGAVESAISTKLMVNNPPTETPGLCEPWFNYIDVLTRIVFNVVRVGRSAMMLQKCTPIKALGEGLGESVGRRGGGASAASSFAMNVGSNTAGNDEEDEL